MSASAPVAPSSAGALALARDVIAIEARAIAELASRLDQGFARAVDEPPGRIEVSVHPSGAGCDAVEHALLESCPGVPGVTDRVDLTRASAARLL